LYKNAKIGVLDYRDDIAAEKHSRIAFSAFCKFARDDDLTDEESYAIKFCDGNSMLYVRPAIFDAPKPYPDFNFFQFPPPDVLHTVIGGYLKFFVTTACIIVAKVGDIFKKYAGNLKKFDEMIMNFPTEQALGFKLKKFRKGVTPHAGKIGGTSTTQGRFQYVLSYSVLSLCTLRVLSLCTLRYFTMYTALF
jgi:hypothetical protein